MARWLGVLTVVVLTSHAHAAPVDCAALMRFEGEIPILTVSGSSAERGYAQGYCLAEDIVDVIDDYVLENVSAIAFAVMKGALQPKMLVPEGMKEEAKGVVEGMRAKLGEDAESRRLGRLPDVDDVLLINAYVDYRSAQCSSMSAWGEATRRGSLAGEAALARNLDWTSHPTLVDRQLVIVHKPSEPDREPLLSVTFPGLLGCLSCVDASGTAAFLNMGQGEHRGVLAEAKSFQPVTLSLREAIERRDPDKDGRATVADVEHVMKSVPTVGSYGIHVLAAETTAGEEPALVLELNAKGLATRTSSRTERFGADTLGLTNHLQLLDEEVLCDRYEKLARRSRAKSLDGRKLWKAMRAVFLKDRTLQTMLYVPSKSLLRLWLRPLHHKGRSPWKKARVLDLQTLFQ